MKEKMNRCLRKHWKPLIGMSAIVVLAAGILIVFDLESKQNMLQTSSETGGNRITSE